MAEIEATVVGAGELEEPLDLGVGVGAGRGPAASGIEGNSVGTSLAAHGRTVAARRADTLSALGSGRTVCFLHEADRALAGPAGGALDSGHSRQTSRTKMPDHRLYDAPRPNV